MLGRKIELESSRRRIRVFPDYGNPWPIWESGAEIYNPTPSDLGLSDELAAAMRHWYDFWLAHNHYDRGWDLQASEATSKLAGDLFVKQLILEVADFADVSDERGRSVAPWRDCLSSITLCSGGQCDYASFSNE